MADMWLETLTMGLEEFARVIGISKNSAYSAAKEDRLPVPVIRIGRRVVVSRLAVDELLAGRPHVERGPTDDGCQLREVARGGGSR